MNRKTAMKLFGLLGLLMLLSCGYADRHRNNSSCEQVLVDSLEVRVQDSLFSNVHYSRSQVLDALTQAQDSQVYYRLLALYGKTFFVSSDFDSILYYNRRVKEFFRNASQSSESLQSPQWNDVLSDVYNIEGNVWMQLNRPDSAITDYKKAYEYRLKGKKLHLLPDICINTADAYLHRSDLAHTASYYRRALFLCDSLNLSEHAKFPVYYGLGQTYMELRDFDLSNHYYELAGQYFDEMNVSERWTYLNNRGNHYYYRKDYQEALKYMRRANVLVSSYPQMVFEQNFIKVNLGELYLLTDKLDSAQVCLDESYRFFSDIQHNSAVHYIETQMIELVLKKGNIAQAKTMIARTAPVGHLDANMLTIRNQYLQHYFEQIGDYRHAYEYLKRDCHLDDSIRSERVQMRVAELDMRYRQDTIVLRKEMQIQRQAAEMRVLKLSVSLQDELDFVRTYIELERGRVGEDFVATITVEDGLDATRIMIPSMIVQIPVENAIKHGLAGKDGKKELMVYVSRETNGIRITVTDNGRGYLPQVVSATRGTGTGLKVLYQTIQLLNTKNKSDKIRFNITNRSDGQTGTEVSVYIPFRFSYDL